MGGGYCMLIQTGRHNLVTAGDSAEPPLGDHSMTPSGVALEPATPASHAVPSVYLPEDPACSRRQLAASRCWSSNRSCHLG